MRKWPKVSIHYCLVPSGEMVSSFMLIPFALLRRRPKKLTGYSIMYNKDISIALIMAFKRRTGAPPTAK